MVNRLQLVRLSFCSALLLWCLGSVFPLYQQFDAPPIGSRLSVCFLFVCSCICGVLARLTMLAIVYALDHLVARSPMLVVSMSGVVSGVQLLALFLDKIAEEVISAKFQRASDSQIDILFFYFVSSAFYCMVLTDVLLALPTLWSLHNDCSAIQTKTQLALHGKPGKAHEKRACIGLVEHFEATLAPCTICGEDTRAGDAIFCRPASDAAIVEASRFEVVHSNCVFHHAVISRCHPDPLAWLPLHQLDGRNIFVWVYITWIFPLVYHMDSTVDWLESRLTSHKKTKAELFQRQSEPLLAGGA